MTRQPICNRHRRGGVTRDPKCHQTESVNRRGLDICVTCYTLASSRKAGRRRRQRRWRLSVDPSKGRAIKRMRIIYDRYK